MAHPMERPGSAIGQQGRVLGLQVQGAVGNGGGHDLIRQLETVEDFPVRRVDRKAASMTAGKGWSWRRNRCTEPRI